MRMLTSDMKTVFTSNISNWLLLKGFGSSSEEAKGVKLQYRTPYPLEQLKAAKNFNDGVGKCTRGRSVAYFSRVVHFISEQGREAS